MPFRSDRLRFFAPAARLLLAAVAIGLVPAQAQAPADLRVALVIGNAAYARAPLLNPANDAQAMAKALKGLGFDVVELRDGSKEQMAEAIAKVRETLKGKQGVGMLYYAGHGLQLDWRNYMVPVDAKLAKATDVPEQTVDVGSVIEAFKTAGNRMNILVLDACRDNPFSGTASGKGLAQLDAPPGTFLAYATAPGNVAEDGDASTGNGLYTQFLLAELGKPTAKIEDVFKRVRLQVRQKSAGRQIPWESTSLEDDFYFNDALSVAAKAERDRIAASKDARDKAFALEKAAWDRIKDSRNPDDFYAFLQKYPNNMISEVAQAQLERLQRAQTTPVANQQGIVQTPGEARFRLGDTVVSVWRDGYTQVEKQRITSRVVRIDETSVALEDGTVLTPDGGTIRNRFVADLSPPRLDKPAGDYVVGKKWSFRSIQTTPTGQKFWVEGEVKIAALEDVTVPAGTFKAYRLESESINQLGGRISSVYWMQPDWGLSIKMLRTFRPSYGQVERDIYEMVSRTRGAG